MAIRKKAKTKAKSHTSFVRNPSNRKAVATKGKTTMKRNTTKSRKRAATKRNPTVARAKSNKRTTRKRYSFRTNPGGIVGLLISGLIGGVALGFANGITRTFAPANSTNIQILMAAGGSYALDKFGSRLPLIGKYSKNVSWILAVLAGYLAFNHWILPMISRTGLALPGLSLYQPLGYAAPVAVEASEMSGAYLVEGEADYYYNSPPILEMTPGGYKEPAYDSYPIYGY